MTRTLALALALATVMAVSSTPAQAAGLPAVWPGVIGGTPGSPLASAAVALELGDSECTGSLWRPRIVITAAHCVSDSDGIEPAVQPGDVRVYAPGADTRNGPTGVRVTQILFDPAWTSESDDDEPSERDIAFLILNAPLGTPTWTRMATPAEVIEVARAGTPVEYVGYGLTGPRDDPNAVTSPVPLSLTTRLVTRYEGGMGEFVTAGDGVHGTCAGDSGGPFLAVVGGQLVYLGPLSGGLGHPCEAENDDPMDEAAVAAGMGDLAQQALAAAGEGPDSLPTTCIEGADVDRTCVSGVVWTYDFCWSGKRASLQMKTAGGWKTVGRVTGKRTSDCDSDAPYEIVFSQTATQPKSSYRIVLPRQPGLRRGGVDPFTVTSG